MDLSKNKKFVYALKKLTLALIIVAAYSFGWAAGHENLKIDQGFVPRILNKIGNERDVDFSTFWQIWDEVDEKYDGQVDHKKMLNGAISGMVSAVGDPYTYYMTPEEAKEFEDEFSGNISGIGAEVGIKKNQITVIAPLPDSPAEKAGLKPGDAIITIDDNTTTNMTIDEAVSRIRGQEGTDVKLEILRNNESSEVTIKRQTINVKSVYSEIKDNIGILQLRRFSDDTAGLTDTALEDFKSKNVKAIVLDLRNNPGGYLESSVKIAAEFIKKGEDVVIEKHGDKVTATHKAELIGTFTDAKIPIAVLVNEGSASASEIVAGALQDHGRAILIGEQTFGKGSVQELKGYPDNSSLRVTIAHWYTPKGNSITEKGLTPDINVETDETQLPADEDPQLKKALEYLNSKL
ncbi:TPA: peptidase S41 [candidate division CPR2 bacterium]|uniref:Carboxyl-terminal protease n=1 Tax=candidate division CPR2 bacterium GW2011_GWC1_41_48 TaxID=1618344 RepID=A0A0G0W9V0_UNCC2|nr:MAG: Carboxyl-terminal protease [candidate division CPR2 bacterium GW2011_GWC2_39_35]KKR27812.1 MAG: Carboxyl-terminal protease [candidate division CPR2 bacterium GW2011_GWD1_39_7]KKR29429.1 MAG: Carboxyl-terminal protease [candidate division CPR2 bacterium GW2011_GWD2_39_7]KKS09740.1 MAG: Carboxyl-terminal protease [candidate division CPR2 bacterium GW2011_GWC1_41_48]OGB59941.1 MAG: hypothetical protein A2Y27_01770 [candidate division CPR2 bacterium GWD1_39_7]OGB71250.1 MAG: hypothetical p